MREKFIEKRFNESSLEIIQDANDIIEEYEADGYQLTLRQLYYQFVARDLITNTLQSYKRLGSIINDARLAGLVSWTAIEDRTRNLDSNPHWVGPDHAIRSCASWYAEDLWLGQDQLPEVWIEKEALAGVAAQICTRLDVPFFACRGYVSQSEMWVAAKRMEKRWADRKQATVVLHLGDHDPSGIDMTRDNDERLALLSSHVPGLEIRRIALNMDQIEEHNPPPNPAKSGDSRYDDYRLKYGSNSWELDALDPQTLTALIEEHVVGIRDEFTYKNNLTLMNNSKALLRKASDNWSLVETWLEDL